LETVREHARERLSWLPEAVACRHARHYAEVAERAGPALMGHDARRWLGILVEETDNLLGGLCRLASVVFALTMLRKKQASRWQRFSARSR